MTVDCASKSCDVFNGSLIEAVLVCLVVGAVGITCAGIAFLLQLFLPQMGDWFHR